MVHSTDESALNAARDEERARRSEVLLEPVPHLEWSLATEAHPPPPEPATPASLRRSWIHRATEGQVLGLYRKLHGSDRRLPAPWWLRALDRGEIESRAAAFEIEDEVHHVLSNRPGWVFVPWAGISEAGFWEYAPSDRAPMMMPTTVVLTDEHRGWLSVVPAHRDTPPLPVPISGMPGLVAALPQIETW